MSEKFSKIIPGSLEDALSKGVSKEQYELGESMALEHQIEEVARIEELDQELEAVKEDMIRARYNFIATKHLQGMELNTEDLQFMYLDYPHMFYDSEYQDKDERMDDYLGVLKGRYRQEDMITIFGTNLSDEELEAKIIERRKQ
jgi:hypothetical protein